MLLVDSWLSTIQKVGMCNVISKIMKEHYGNPASGQVLKLLWKVGMCNVISKIMKEHIIWCVTKKNFVLDCLDFDLNISKMTYLKMTYNISKTEDPQLRLEIQIGLTCCMLLCLCKRSLVVSAVYAKWCYLLCSHVTPSYPPMTDLQNSPKGPDMSSDALNWSKQWFRCSIFG